MHLPHWLHRLLLAFGLILHALLAATALFWATHLRDPHLLPIRAWEAALLGSIALTGLGLSLWLARQRRWQALFALIWVIVIGLTTFAELAFRLDRHAVLTAEGADAANFSRLGRHLVIGYERPEQIRELVRRGFVAGIFVTRRNVEGKDFAQLRAEIADLQALSREAGLPPLLVTTDQEGGPVSRLSPPLPRQPALAHLLEPGVALEEAERRAEAYGAEQGKALASLGVTVNFSPVVDLKPAQAPDALDFHTRIATRAISANPASVTRVALAYSRGLLAQGVRPTLKHFPGLGSVTGDTHHFSASLDLPRSELEARDWRPFREVLAQTPALLMVGHVVVRDIDPAHPATLSPAVIGGVIRNGWQHRGPLITDDMTMGAVFNRGLCDSSHRALAAGMDYLLVSYDWEHIFPLLRCLAASPDQPG
ncbi:glycoside hydrolase family 3 N-terminal domain-containing protein [Uliginosibacterium sp. 31-16]|uniref:glycoside hydrolase family 3 N-terminal domain-containing protein n=1 Tax=Uliginosibacterium sp. 31-16 TaxID=3068315 RepID=UPI00273D41CC|nr:glycoside hydrolase family 3 N-terminal domain-containing protein [Uliginosibacterium sp. 31-16]MDP5240543.1 glycoside hydrolase family 3 N-terminal domain-containing protein [Uliginosibacterium sp. 31-16]